MFQSALALPTRLPCVSGQCMVPMFSVSSATNFRCGPRPHLQQIMIEAEVCLSHARGLSEGPVIPRTLYTKARKIPPNCHSACLIKHFPDPRLMQSRGIILWYLTIICPSPSQYKTSYSRLCRRQIRVHGENMSLQSPDPNYTFSAQVSNYLVSGP